jgi:hypothetical protein
MTPKRKVLVEYQTFSKADLEDAINYECTQWEKLRKAFPAAIKELNELPFDPRNAYWPEIEKSQRLRAEFEQKSLPPPPQYNAGEPVKINSNIKIPQPHQNASQYNSSSTDFPDIQYLSKYRRGLEDAEERRQQDIDKINKDYAQALEDMVKASSLKASNMDDNIFSGILNEPLVDYKDLQDRAHKWSSKAKRKNDEGEVHWLWRYCIPYVGLSGLAAFIAHLLRGM